MTYAFLAHLPYWCLTCVLLRGIRSAFVKPYITTLDPCVDSCMVELSTSLGTIFLTRLATGSIVAVAVPYIMQKMRIRKETKGEC